MSRILTINCGSTSTKVAFFVDDTEIARASLDVPLADLATMPKVLDQTAYRTDQVRAFLQANQLDATSADIVVARAGTIHHVRHDGAYAVNDLMVATLTYAPAAQHASALSCLIGRELVAGTDIPVIIYDPTCVDSVDEIAKVTRSRTHPVNSSLWAMPPVRMIWSTAPARTVASWPMPLATP